MVKSILAATLALALIAPVGIAQASPLHATTVAHKAKVTQVAKKKHHKKKHHKKHKKHAKTTAAIHTA